MGRKITCFIIVGMAALLFMLTGCNLPSVKSNSPSEVRYYRASYDAVWNAAVDSLDELGYVVVQMSKGEGYISTGKRERDNRRTKIGIRLVRSGDTVGVKMTSSSEFYEKRSRSWGGLTDFGAGIQEVRMKMDHILHGAVVEQAEKAGGEAGR